MNLRINFKNNAQVFKSIKCTLLLLLLCTSFVLKAQYAQDSELWTSVGISGNATKKISYSVEEALRLKSNMQQLSQTFTDIGAQYKVYKWLKVGANYRLILKPNNNPKHRLYINAAIKTNWNNFVVSNRLRYQIDYEKNNLPNKELRNKINIAFDRKKIKFKPYIAFEAYYHFLYSGNQFDNLRYYAGCGYDITKNINLDAYYLLQQSINVEKLSISHIVGIGINYNIGN